MGKVFLDLGNEQHLYNSKVYGPGVAEVDSSFASIIIDCHKRVTGGEPKTSYPEGEEPSIEAPVELEKGDASNVPEYRGTVLATESTSKDTEENKEEGALEGKENEPTADKKEEESKETSTTTEDSTPATTTEETPTSRRRGASTDATSTDTTTETK